MKTLVASPFGFYSKEVAERFGVKVGIVYNQILYWHRPSAKGESKLRVFKEGLMWLAKSYAQLARETGLTATSVRRAIATLQEAGFIIVKKFSFNRSLTNHMRLNLEALPESLAALFHPIKNTLEKITARCKKANENKHPDAPLQANPPAQTDQPHLPFWQVSPAEMTQSLTETVTETVTESTTENSPYPTDVGQKAGVSQVEKEGSRAEEKAGQKEKTGDSAAPPTNTTVGTPIGSIFNTIFPHRRDSASGTPQPSDVLPPVIEPTPPSGPGRRRDGTNPRATNTNPRARNENPRAQPGYHRPERPVPTESRPSAWKVWTEEEWMKDYVPPESEKGQELLTLTAQLLAKGTTPETEQELLALCGYNANELLHRGPRELHQRPS